MRGFTLIEILVVIAIIAFVVGIAIPSFSAFTGRRRLVEATREVKSTLKDAQSRALSSIDGLNWGVHFEKGSNSFVLFSFSGDFDYGSATAEVSHKLPSGVVISDLSSQSGNHVNVVFSVLKGAVYFVADNGSCLGGSEDSSCPAPRCLSIGLQSSGQKRYIKVNERNIFEDDNYLPCP